MTKTEVAKKISFAVVGTATTAVVHAIVKNNVSANKLSEKVALAVGTYVLGCIAADATKKWTDAKIDELIQWWIVNVKDNLPQE
jgi:hypothetical protein